MARGQGGSRIAREHGGPQRMEKHGRRRRVRTEHGGVQRASETQSTHKLAINKNIDLAVYYCSHLKHDGLVT